ncbi:hypothetical protein HNP52_002213 [Sphingomonas kyeonggiensis]|uniref:Uncharacterized protein n=1 Tax=Sphingomonas kyeonggiensis TaxID=1268553 RepID=A0A7W7K192_9SPHN|nr:hypothetical protein [Sphingomonas kyeonggiensis]
MPSHSSDAPNAGQIAPTSTPAAIAISTWT